MDPDLASLFQSPVQFVSSKLGVNEAGVKIITTLLLGYPLAIIYNLFIIHRNTLVKKLFFIITGFLLGFFNHGYKFLHTTTTILTMYIVLKVFGGCKFSVGFAFTFCTGYLMWGYYYTQTDEYSFDWTIPHCILTLRLIAVAFDVYDGQRLKNKQLNSCGEPIKNEAALSEPPKLLDLFANSYFPFSFMVGPQFEYKRFLEFLDERENNLHLSLPIGLTKFILGLIYLFFHVLGEKYLPVPAMESNYFKESGFFWSFTIIAAVIKIQFCKYIAIWLLTDGSFILSGLPYDKRTRTFRAYNNVDPYLFETTTTFEGIIRSFNLTTNQWSGKYIFKRLKSLGNRVLSHAFTLGYLAIWHGWKSGYYNTFMMEFLIMKFEWEVLATVERLRQKDKSLDRLLNSSYVRWPRMIFAHFYTVYMIGYCMASFMLLSYSRWIPVLRHVRFAGHFIYISWIFIAPLVRSLIKTSSTTPSRSRTEKELKSQ